MSAQAARKLRPRNATEDAILAAAREALVEDGYEKLTMDGIARRAFTSRTNVYFYFANKRAVVDRLVQQTFADMLVAGAPYLDGARDPRPRLRQARRPLPRRRGRPAPRAAPGDRPRRAGRQPQRRHPAARRPPVGDGGPSAGRV